MTDADRAWLVIGVLLFVGFFVVGFVVDHFTKRVVSDPDSERLKGLLRRK